MVWVAILVVALAFFEWGPVAVARVLVGLLLIATWIQGLLSRRR
jgi:hypothetical protein